MTRKVSRSVLAWAFGMSVSILFLSLWGRAVVVDTDALADSLSPLAGSDIVSGLVGDWMAEEMVDAGGDPEIVEPTVDYYMRSSEVGGALDQLVVEVVDAAASTDPDGDVIDMAALIGPAVPELTMALNQMGHEVGESQVSQVVGQLDPLVIREPGSGSLVGPASPTASRLGTAALLAVLALLGLGSGYVLLSEDRVGAVRSLANRVAVGGLSFAVFLRVGSWVLDPEGGRAPVQETVSALAGSKWMVPLEVAFVAAVVAAAIYLVRRRVRPEEVTPSSDERSTQPSDQQQSLSTRR